MKTEISYPAHSGWGGPVSTVHFVVGPDELTGTYLDYALAMAVGHEYIQLHFTMAFTPESVVAGADGSNLRAWSPTRDPELARSLSARYLGRASEVVSTTDLRAIVSSVLGQEITIAKPVRDTA